MVLRETGGSCVLLLFFFLTFFSCWLKDDSWGSKTQWSRLLRRFNGGLSFLLCLCFIFRLVECLLKVMSCNVSSLGTWDKCKPCHLPALKVPGFQHWDGDEPGVPQGVDFLESGVSGNLWPGEVVPSYYGNLPSESLGMGQSQPQMQITILPYGRPPLKGKVVF